MRIILTSVFVDDQEKALRFYTGTLGFVKEQDFPAGEYRWLTVTSPEGPDGVALLLEPNANPLSIEYQKGLYEQGIPAATFGVDDVAAEVERLRENGVVIRSGPTDLGGAVVALFEDTCGNLIQIAQA